MSDGPITLGEFAVIWAIAMPFACIAALVAWVAHRIGRFRSSAGRPGARRAA